jgi:hypothetical protein
MLRYLELNTTCGCLFLCFDKPLGWPKPKLLELSVPQTKAAPVEFVERGGSDLDFILKRAKLFAVH